MLVFLSLDAIFKVFLLLTLIICNCYNGHLVSREKPVRIYGRANTLSQLVWNWCLIFTSCFLIIQQLSPSQKSVLDHYIVFCSLYASTINSTMFISPIENFDKLMQTKVWTLNHLNIDLPCSRFRFVFLPQGDHILLSTF